MYLRFISSVFLFLSAERKTGLTAACRGFKKNGKCRLRYCKNCICNRYPLIADEVLKEEAWECPKCRNDCNCSKCKKRRGEEPAGPMVHAVKRLKGNPRRIESTVARKDEIVVPKGTLVNCIAGVEMQPEDVGAAIQFLEFCRSFGEIFQITKGQAEKIVKDITGDRQLREVSSVVAELHANLLSVIENGNYKKLRTRIEGRDYVARQKIRVATEKEKELKERHNDMAKTMGGEIAGNEEANNIFCQIKEAKEVKQAAMNGLVVHGEMITGCDGIHFYGE
ncbi:uncharacterized protein LOC123401451 isoform X3 [Hordeum vulgare subsp. vulgare]|uniref:uncharacterized protein LOC123401451 isoform X3 n=1 Tax=Hordeum vulgare subsp. vulgare TaxID=112509 RepID=UPI001D1A44EF|nr:uncharacterized protein LOC123401451 isoform X3 [Hordeum vulgare subsp. vulgare]